MCFKKIKRDVIGRILKRHGIPEIMINILRQQIFESIQNSKRFCLSSKQDAPHTVACAHFTGVKGISLNSSPWLQHKNIYLWRLPSGSVLQHFSYRFSFLLSFSFYSLLSSSLLLFSPLLFSSFPFLSWGDKNSDPWNQRAIFHTLNKSDCDWICSQQCSLVSHTWYCFSVGEGAAHLTDPYVYKKRIFYSNSAIILMINSYSTSAVSEALSHYSRSFAALSLIFMTALAKVLSPFYMWGNWGLPPSRTTMLKSFFSLTKC